MYTSNMTVREFKRHAVRLLKHNNPDARRLKIAWVRKPKEVVYPTGIHGILGRISVNAPGYKPSLMIVDWDSASGWSIR